MGMEHKRDDSDMEKTELLGKETYSSVTLSITSLTRTDLESKWRLYDDRPVTNCLSLSKVIYTILRYIRYMDKIGWSLNSSCT